VAQDLQDADLARHSLDIRLLNDLLLLQRLHCHLLTCWNMDAKTHFAKSTLTD
jgi:hypothetical protein